MASRTASEIWSAILSGCPSVTDSEVKWKLLNRQLLVLDRDRSVAMSPGPKPAAVLRRLELLHARHPAAPVPGRPRAEGWHRVWLSRRHFSTGAEPLSDPLLAGRSS